MKATCETSRTVVLLSNSSEAFDLHDHLRDARIVEDTLHAGSHGRVIGVVLNDDGQGADNVVAVKKEEKSKRVRGGGERGERTGREPGQEARKESRTQRREKDMPHGRRANRIRHTQRKRQSKRVREMTSGMDKREVPSETEGKRTRRREEKRKEEEIRIRWSATTAIDWRGKQR